MKWRRRDQEAEIQSHAEKVKAHLPDTGVQPSAAWDHPSELVRVSERLDLLARGAVAIASRLTLMVPTSDFRLCLEPLAPGQIQVLDERALLLPPTARAYVLPLLGPEPQRLDLILSAGLDWTLNVTAWVGTEESSTDELSSKTERAPLASPSSLPVRISRIAYAPAPLASAADGSPDGFAASLMPIFREIAGEARREER